MQDALIRAIDASSAQEVELVARRMRDTLIEVEGQEIGSSLYTLDWLAARVRWHLDPHESKGQVLVAMDQNGNMVGHTIFRVERARTGDFGLISTTYVVPGARRLKLGQKLLEAAETWFASHLAASSTTWTSSTNLPLISLYRSNGYKIVDSGPNDLTGTTMVNMRKVLSPVRGEA